MEEELKIPPIWNKNIDVVELVQTAQLITQTANQIKGEYLFLGQTILFKDATPAKKYIMHLLLDTCCVPKIPT